MGGPNNFDTCVKKKEKNVQKVYSRGEFHLATDKYQCESVTEIQRKDISGVHCKFNYEISKERLLKEPCFSVRPWSLISKEFCGT